MKVPSQKDRWRSSTTELVSRWRYCLRKYTKNLTFKERYCISTPIALCAVQCSVICMSHNRNGPIILYYIILGNVGVYLEVHYYRPQRDCLIIQMRLLQYLLYMLLRYSYVYFLQVFLRDFDDMSQTGIFTHQKCHFPVKCNIMLEKQISGTLEH